MSVATLFDVNNAAYEAESIRVYNLFVDGTLHANITPGTITPGVNNTFLRTDNLGVVQFQPFLLSYLPGGATGTVLTSTGSTVAWIVPTTTPGSIIPGTNGQVLVTQGGVSQWTSNPNIIGNFGVTGASTFTGNGLFRQDLAVTNDLNVLNGDLAVINGGFEVTTGLSKVQTLDIAGNLLFNTSAGVTGQYVQQSGSGPIWANLAASDIKGGTLNQLLQSDGTNAVYNTDITFPGNIAMSIPSISSLDETRIYGPLKLGGNNAGITGQVCIANGTSVPSWQNPQYVGQWYQNSPLQDMNGASTVILMSSASVNIKNSNISYNGTGMWTLAEEGTYQLTFETQPSTSAAKTRVNFRINGVFAGSTNNIYIPAITESQQLILQKTYRLNANSTIEIVSEPVIAGTINTSGSDANGIATTMLTITRIGAYA